MASSGSLGFQEQQQQLRNWSHDNFQGNTNQDVTTKQRDVTRQT